MAADHDPRRQWYVELEIPGCGQDDWRDKLDAFLKFNERKVLYDTGKVSMEIAQKLAHVLRSLATISG